MHITNKYRILTRLILPYLSAKRNTYRVIKRPDPALIKTQKLEYLPSLMDLMKEKIRLNGPMTVADYMNIIITNPIIGYYMKKEVIGEGGDFITSPEISQLFGEILAIWFISETQKMSSGKPLQIVELGPGKGTLLLDFLRVLSRLGFNSQDLSIHLVETSSTMQDIQARALCVSHTATDVDLPYNYEGVTLSGIKVYWYNDLQKVPKNFSWYIAHEFFDALPIHKFERTDKGWREILIDLDESGKLQYKISADETPSVRLLIRPPLGDGNSTKLEISARSISIARQLAQRVDEYGGIALIADYGHEGEKGDTFRAFHKHQLVNPLENPGVNDVTADVDFRQLRIAASKTHGEENHAIVFGPVTQKDFLERLHAKARLEVLIQNAKTEKEKQILQNGYDMLVNPKEMGEKFKLMAFYPSTMASFIKKYPPLGFSTVKL